MVAILGGGSNATSNITYQYAGGTTEGTRLGSEDWDIHSLCQPTNVVNTVQYNTIKFMTSIKLLHFSTPECHSEAVF